ncbi:MAG: nhaA [Solirubrobacterales bacterium]|nr:nhaA [Solirubrobacterales bacterium]
MAALAWANSPWPHSYESVWTTKLAIRLGHWQLSDDLRHWVNDGLLVFFFFVVGLEARREMDMGELRERRRLALPVMAAIGGMVVPIAIYQAINAGGPGAHGWGAAMSTDTAFALGVLALVGPRCPQRLRVFILTLVVVDDIGGLLVIGTVYTDHVDLVALGVAVALFAAFLAARRIPEVQGAAYVVLGTALWVAMHQSGVHPTIAGLLLGLTTSAYPPARSDLERATAITRLFREQPTPELARSAQRSVESAISPNERLQHRLHPWTSYAIVPVFALANAGIHIDGTLLRHAATSPVTLGIVAGYVIGKPVGVLTAAWLASHPRFGGTRPPVGWPTLAGGAAVAGIGFTVSLLIASLAFHGELLAEAKLGVLAAAVLATLVSLGLFRVAERLPESIRLQLGPPGDEILDLARDVDPERDHIRGPVDAPVTLVEYGDYECPYCGQAERIIRELLADFGDDVRYVWRHLPLNDVHEHAQIAAEAAEAAGAQGRFWEMHDRLFTHQDDLRPPTLRRDAEELGLDVERFSDEVRRRVHAPRVAEDVATADASGVSGTPTFFINGRRHEGAYDVDTLSNAVRTARTRAQVASATA